MLLLQCMFQGLKKKRLLPHSYFIYSYTGLDISLQIVSARDTYIDGWIENCCNRILISYIVRPVQTLAFKL